MLRTLLETRPIRARTRSAAVGSFIVHVALAGTAIAATATRDTEPKGPVTVQTTVTYVAPRRDPRPTPNRPQRPKPAPQVPSPIVVAPAPVLVAPTTVPDHLPEIDPNATPTVEPNYGPGGQIFESTDPGTGGGTDPDAGVRWADEVEVAAAPIGRQREPRYPEILRSSRVEGGVTVVFIVDSTGRVEPGSFRAVESSHALFEPAVKAAVLAQRFRPAKWRGQPVRQLVQQRFVFTLAR